MIVIPIQTGGGGHGPMGLVIILEAENLKRMREGDPLDFQPHVLGNHFNMHRSIRDLTIIVAYEEDLKPIMQFQKVNDLVGLMTYLERGRRHEPGDAVSPLPLRET